MYFLGHYQITLINDLYHFFLNLFFIAFWGFQSGASFNTPFWSVSIEEGIFILFFLTHRYIFSFGVFLPLAILGFGATISHYGTPIWYFGLCAWFFYTGVLLHYLISKIKSTKFWVIAGAVSIVCFMYLLQQYLNKKNIPFHNVAFFLFFPVLTLTVKLDMHKISNKKNIIKICNFFSSLTYSSYLIHFPIQILILILVDVLNIDAHIFDRKSIFLTWIIATIVLSRACYVYLEKPLQIFFLRSLPDYLKLKRLNDVD